LSRVLILHAYSEGFAHITAIDYNANQRVLTFKPLTKCEHTFTKFYFNLNKNHVNDFQIK